MRKLEKMRINIVSSIIFILLANDSRADEQTKQNSLITSYDSGASSAADSNFRNNGQISQNDRPPDRPIKFEDNPKGQGQIDIDKAEPSLLLADISFDNEGFNSNDRISNNVRHDNENTGQKITFEENDDVHDDINDDVDNDQEDDDDAPPRGSGQVVFEENNKNENDSPYADDSDREEETVDKPIKFEDQKSNSNTINQENVTERVAFIDDSNQKQEPVRKKKPRKLRYQTKQPNQGPTDPNSSYPGSGYPFYPGAGFPNPGYPVPGDPNAGYPGYPISAYPTPGYAYPGYPTPYPGAPIPTPLYPGGAFPTPSYPGYPTPAYPAYKYPLINPAYAGHPTPGYQPQYPEDQKPQSNPIYPTPVTGDPNGQPDSRYPSPQYPNPGSPIGSTQNGHLGFPNPTPDYPYYQGYPVPGYVPGYPGDPNAPQPGYRPGYGYLGVNQPGYQTGNGRPSRRPKSLTQRAVSAVAEALTSIALYDDYQCVPKILCEVAGGSRAVSSPALLKATESLQPLLTLLAAYNGLSSSPLFLFGRAAVTGMTAKGDPSVCHRTYPQCPTDPEKLVHYLNNHNGGFFRFFGQPEQSQQPQNLEQFYNYLSGQYGFQQQPQQQQNYGLLRPYGQGYGYPNQTPFNQPQNYGQNYYSGHNRYRNGNIETAESEIQERIQNKPVFNVLEDENDQGNNANQDNGAKWLFPEDPNRKKGNKREQIRVHKEVERPTRGSKTLKFPDDRSDDRREIFRIKHFPRSEKQIYFPGHNHFQIYSAYQTTTPVNLEEYVFDHKHNFYVKRPKAMKVEDVNVVYVVRGNGDPNHPEIVRIRPGQSITK